MNSNCYTLLLTVVFCVFVSYAQDKEIDRLLKALESYQTRDTTRINNLIAISDYYFLSDTHKAEPYIKEAIDIAKSIKDYRRISSLKTAMGRSYVTRGLFNEALENVLEAVKILDSIKAGPEQKIHTLNILSTVYRGYGDNDKSLAVALEVLKLSKELPLSAEQSKYHYNAGQSYATLNKHKKAEGHFYKALEVAKALHDEHNEIIMTSVLGDHFKKIGVYEKAKTMINISLPYYKRKSQYRNLASSYRILGEIESLEGKHQKAIPYYRKALSLYDQTGNLHYSKLTNQQLFIAYSIIQDKEKASQANIRYNQLKDSLNSRERKALVAEMDKKFEIEKTKQELKFSQLENKRNENLFLGTLIVFGLLGLTAVFAYGRMRAKKQTELVQLELEETKKRLDLEKQYRSSELKALRSQMNPHFIFNALNSIQDYIIFNEKKLARTYLIKFSRLIRRFLEHSQIDSIPLSEEIEALTLYLELEKARFEDSFMYELDIDQDVHVELIQIPTFLVQPHVENAIKHGLLHKKENRKLIIRFKLDDKKSALICIVDDNGIGRKASKSINDKNILKPKSFATSANIKRIELLNKTRKNAICVKIVDKVNSDGKVLGTLVKIIIPLNG